MLVDHVAIVATTSNQTEQESKIKNQKSVLRNFSNCALIGQGTFATQTHTFYYYY